MDSGQPVFNPAMTFHNTYATYVVKLAGADFEWVRRLQEEGSRDALTTLDPDHYLFKFSDAELFELLAKPEEWSPLDVTLAGQLLRQRGRDVSADTIRLLREHRTIEQKRPEESQKPMIMWGYVLAALGGIRGAVSWAGSCTRTKRPSPMAGRCPPTRPTTGCTACAS